jgi:putative NADPH-quinone reductase
MRVLVLYAHPNPASYGAAIKAEVVAALTEAGHKVDLCDLYAEKFDPVLSESERLGYHDEATNQIPVAGYVKRVQEADALVLVHPIWNFGYPAILKGFLDRVFLPGVSFKLVDGRVQGALTHLKTVVTVTTYGAHRWRAFAAGNPPKRFATRVLRAVTGLKAKVEFLAHYDMNRSTPESRAAFLARVRARMLALGH